MQEDRFGLVFPDYDEPIVEQCKQGVQLRRFKSLANNPGGINHLLIKGDNYACLKAVLRAFAGRIDIQYIDPPYNKEGDFIYNDSRIDKTHPFKHGMWCSFMKKRLELARELLSDRGVIFISIDDAEHHHLRCVCDQVFGEDCFIANIVWKKNKKPQNASNTCSTSAEYLLVYSKIPKGVKLTRPMEGVKCDEQGSWTPYPTIKMDGREKSTHVLRAGTLVEGNNFKKGRMKAPRNEHGGYEVLDDPIVENGILTNEVRVVGEFCLTNKAGLFDKAQDEKRIYVAKSGGIKEKRYRPPEARKVHTNLWTEVGYNEDGKQELDRLLGQDNVFPYPKPVALIREVLSSVDYRDALVMDFFAGSGTTGQAVLEQNDEDAGTRRFILCTNNENGIFDNVTSKRLESVFQGRTNDNLTYLEVEFLGLAQS